MTVILLIHSTALCVLQFVAYILHMDYLSFCNVFLSLSIPNQYFFSKMHLYSYSSLYASHFFLCFTLPITSLSTNTYIQFMTHFIRVIFMSTFHYKLRLIPSHCSVVCIFSYNSINFFMIVISSLSI